MRITLEGLFSLCFNNEVAREEFVNIINQKDNKKYIKLLKDWMKEADRFYNNVKIDKMGYWRRIGKSTYSHLERMDSDSKVSTDRYLGLLNSLLEKHKI